MDRPRALGLLWALLTLCLTAGTPEVWLQVQREATEASFTVRCGFLGSGSISLVTVSYGGPDGAGGTTLAVLHPIFGTKKWTAACQARWETSTSVSLTLERAPTAGRGSSSNTTFCCKFTSFPEGSQEACGNLSLSTDQGGADEEGGRRDREGLGAPATSLVCLSGHRAPCSQSSPRAAGRPGWDPGGLRGPPLWLHLPSLPPASAEALVGHEASAAETQQPPDRPESQCSRPSLPDLLPRPLRRRRRHRRHDHQLLQPGNPAPGPPTPATARVGAAPPLRRAPTPEPRRLGAPAGLRAQQLRLGREPTLRSDGKAAAPRPRRPHPAPGPSGAQSRFGAFRSAMRGTPGHLPFSSPGLWDAPLCWMSAFRGPPSLHSLFYP